MNYFTVQVVDDEGNVITAQDVSPGGDGHARCGVNFNPDGNEDVDKLKMLAAGFMQACSELRDGAEDGDGKRCFSTAMTDMESAQMFAVKGLFTARNRGADG